MSDQNRPRSGGSLKAAASAPTDGDNHDYSLIEGGASPSPVASLFVTTGVGCLVIAAVGGATLGQMELDLWWSGGLAIVTGLALVTLVAPEA
mgnify:CR=1 FL=1